MARTRVAVRSEGVRTKPVQAVSGSERGILATVDALQTASRKGDGRTICGDLFTPQLVKSVEAAAKRSCAKEVRKRLFAPDAEISVGRDIKVTGDRGTAVVREQNGNVSTLSLLRQSSSVAYRPRQAGDVGMSSCRCRTE